MRGKSQARFNGGQDSMPSQSLPHHPTTYSQGDVVAHVKACPFLQQIEEFIYKVISINIALNLKMHKPIPALQS